MFFNADNVTDDPLFDTPPSNTVGNALSVPLDSFLATTATFIWLVADKAGISFTDAFAVAIPILADVCATTPPTGNVAIAIPMSVINEPA